MQAQLSQQGLNLDMYCQFMSTTEEKLREDAVHEAEARVRIDATVAKIVELEALAVTDEEMAQIDDAIRRALGLEEEAPRNIYDPKPWRDVRRAAETDQLKEQLAEAKEQAESWRRVALHLMERSA